MIDPFKSCRTKSVSASLLESSIVSQLQTRLGGEVPSSLPVSAPELKALLQTAPRANPDIIAALMQGFARVVRDFSERHSEANRCKWTKDLPKNNSTLTLWRVFAGVFTAYRKRGYGGKNRLPGS
jgi:hypothetical protein